MKTYVIGDIHGCLTAFNALLKALSLGPKDRLITVGDYVDRGDDSKGVLDRLIGIKHAQASQQGPEIIPLRGNHEIMMEQATLGPKNHHFWAVNGGYETLRSFGLSYEGKVNDIPRPYWNFFDTLLPYYETDHFIIVHAGLDAQKPLSQQEDSDLYWKRFHLAQAHYSGKVTVVGHSIQQSKKPTFFNQTIGIDTHAFDEQGFLSALCLNDLSYIQSNNRGIIRTGQVRP